MPSTRLALLALAATAALVACGESRTVEGEQGSTDCTTCHGFPPPPGANGSAAATHPNNTSCWTCHGTSVASGTNEIIAGGAHLNGVVDVTGGHAEGYAEAAVHGPEANAAITSCQQCHGTDFAGGTSGRSCTECHQTAGFADWQTNCTFCHGTQTAGWTTASSIALAAPPEGVSGQTAATDAAVGAHQKHLPGVSTLSAGFTCAECHPPVAALLDATHLGAAPAEVQFGPRATTGGLVPVYTPAASPTCATTYCHGASLVGGTTPTPTWTSTAALACSSCHGAPPNTGLHTFHATSLQATGESCEVCHDGYSATTVNQTMHVNGAGEAVIRPTAGGTLTITGWVSPADCNACHAALGRGP